MLMFSMKFSMEKQINFFWIAGFFFTLDKCNCLYQEIMTLLAVLGVRSTHIPSAPGEVSWERVGSVIAHRGRHVATTTIFWIMLSDPHTYA